MDNEDLYNEVFGNKALIALKKLPQASAIRYLHTLNSMKNAVIENMVDSSTKNDLRRCLVEAGVAGGCECVSSFTSMTGTKRLFYLYYGYSIANSNCGLFVHLTATGQNSTRIQVKYNVEGKTKIVQFNVQPKSCHEECKIEAKAILYVLGNAAYGVKRQQQKRYPTSWCVYSMR